MATVHWSRLLPRRAETPVFSLPEGQRVYAVGDVHGRADLLPGLERRIAADMASRPAPDEALVIFLGDYVDRGADSWLVIERLARGHFADLPGRFLLGNHEHAMLTFLSDPIWASDWLAWGGDATLASYGVPVPDRGDEAKLRSAAATLMERVPLAHLDFLQSLETTIVLGDYLFVHAGVRPRVALDRQRRDDLLFIREPFLSAKRSLGYRVVHGHTVAPEVELLPYRIGVDTGAFETGRLSVVAIEGTDARILPDAESADTTAGYVGPNRP